MKKRIGKIVGLVCMIVLALVLGFHIDVNEAQAESSNSENIIACDGGTFYVELVSADEAEIGGTTVPVSKDQPDYLFAGWFLDDTCKQAVKQKIDGVATYYAKFVPAEVLGVKLQVKHDAAYSDNTNMRIISSVDSLDYANVGFEVYFNSKIGTNTTSADISSEKVFERITTGSQSGITYNYSPQIIDAESKYFVTATLINIKKTSYDKPFHIVPYWITYDGVKVYGPSRYVTIQEDAFDNNVANFPVKIDAETGDEVSLTTKAGTTSANVLYHDGTYAHLRVNKPTVSLTKYTVTNASSKTATVYYRNLNTKYAGTTASADTSWYDAYKDENDNVSQTKFIIATSADLYGLASVSLKNGGLAGKTVYMITDIQANKGAATTSGWKKAAGDGTQYDWTPVGTADVKFQGAFDGNGFKIDGICISAQSTAYMGLFAYADGCSISNLYLMNSYMNSTLNSGSAEAGGFVGSGAGIFNNLYSNAIICTKKPRVGGIMGSTSSSQKNESSMTNCWFDGKIILNGNGQYAYCGGILGTHFNGTVEMRNCLFTGEIDATSSHASNFDSRIGGMVGNVNKNLTLNMTNCLSAGIIDVKSSKTGVTPKNYDPVFEKVYASSHSVTKVYASQESNFSGVEQIDLTGQDEVESTVSIDDALSAFNATEQLWSKTSIRGGNMLVPSCFSGNTIANTPDTSWYNGANATAGTETDPYVLRNSNDLYGLAHLVNNENISFEGKYIVLVDDIKLNDGDANDWDKNAPAYKWTPIGTSATNSFLGVLNGNGHEISGMYINTTKTVAGLFGYAVNCDISNLYLVNSYIKSTKTGVGSIIGQGDGTLTNVYSDAIIHSTNQCIGGFVGRIIDEYKDEEKTDTHLVIENCWFDGTITSTRSSEKAYAGGVLGYVVWGSVTVDSCLYTGTINVISSYNGESVSCIGGIIGSSNQDLAVTLSNTLSAGTINVVNNGGEDTKITNVGSVAGLVRNGWSASNGYVSTDSYETISNGKVVNNNTKTVDLSDSDSINSCLAVLNAEETTWEVRTLRNRTIPVPKNFKHFEYEDAVPVCIYDSTLTYDNAQGGLRIYIPSKKGYINYNFVHTVTPNENREENTKANSDIWRLSVASLADYNKNHIKDITESGAEWEMAIRLLDRGDFIGGYAHGDEIFNTIEVMIDGQAKTIENITDYQTFDEMKIEVTSVGYDPLDGTTAVLNHHKEYIITQNGITLNQTVEWLGEYTLHNKFNSYLAMMPPLKHVEGDETDIITDCYYVTKGGEALESSYIPNPVSYNYVDTSDSNCDSFCVYGIDSGVYFTMGQKGESPVYSETRSFIHDNSGKNYNKMYISFANTDTISAGTVWSATTTYQIDWK